MKKIKNIQIIAGIFIFIGVIIFMSIRRKEGLSTSDQLIRKLPKFETIDITGRIIKRANFKGKNVYIQFIDPFNVDDIHLIKEVYSNWRDENLSIVVFTNDSSEFKFKSEIDIKDIIVSDSNYEKLKTIFNSPQDNGTYYLFNDLGNTVKIEDNKIGYEKGAKVFLNQLIKNKYFLISDFVKINENIRNIKWFLQVAEIVDYEDKNYFVISMFTSICDTCQEGLIINALKKYHSNYKNSIYVLCVLSQNFNSRDLKNLKNQMEINFSVVIADRQLSQRWNFLIDEFGEQYLTNILFLLNKNGQIIRVADPGCNCIRDFMNFVETLTET